MSSSGGDPDGGGDCAVLSSPAPLLSLSVRSFLSCATPEELESILSGCLPPGIFAILLRAALDRNSSAFSPLSVRYILKHWPDPVLRLSEAFPLGPGNRAPPDQKTVLELLWAFLDGLGHADRAQLRTLDLRGAPIVNTERAIERHASLLADPMLDNLEFGLIVDLDLNYESDYRTWCWALRTRDRASGRVPGHPRVKVGRLACVHRAGEAGDDSTPGLLSGLDPEYLTGLALKHLEVTNGELARAEPALSRLTGLEALDLSCGKLIFSKSYRGIMDDAASQRNMMALPRILRCLPKLRRLNLANNKLGGSLSDVLEDCSFRLEALNLRNCGLLPADLVLLDVLARRPALAGLADLDLGDNNLSECAGPLVCLLDKLPALESLSLEECALRESALPERLGPALRRRVARLRRLNLAGHHWPAAALAGLAAAVVVPGSGSALEELVLPIYGLRDMQFRFKDRSNPAAWKSQPLWLSRRLEHVDGVSSDLEEVRAAVEAAAGVPVAAASTAGLEVPGAPGRRRFFMASLARAPAATRASSSSSSMTVKMSTQLDGLKFTFVRRK